MSKSSGKRYKLTGFSKFLIVLFCVALAGGGISFGIKKGWIKLPEKKEATSTVSNEGNVKPSSNKKASTSNDKKTKLKSNTINLSLDEWVGWSGILIANGGLTTTDDSIFGKLGIKVNISVINDSTQSSNALISGKINAAGYTVNRLAFLSNKFRESGVDVVMPYITNYSSGGDGIIASSSIKTINDLVGKKIGCAQYSEAHSLIIWFVNKSDLGEKDKKSIIENIMFFNTADEAARAFFAGELDAAATWEPYLSQAIEGTDSHILFSTSSSTNLILDGICFDKSWAESNRETVDKFIQGSIEANEKYGKETATLEDTFPMFSGMDETAIKDMCSGAKLLGWKNNKEFLSSNAVNVYKDFLDVWESINEVVYRDNIDTLFDTSYIEDIADEFNTETETKIVADSATKISKKDINTIKKVNALITKSVTINFIPNTCKFIDQKEASTSLKEFLDMANTLDGAIIQIEGNVAADKDKKEYRVLSKSRAETVKKWLVSQGISSDRIVVIGNGASKQIASNDTSEGCLKNRRVDIMFKMLESIE